MKKILFIGMTSNVGGIETYINNVCRNLDFNNYKVFFPYIKNMVYVDELKKLGAEVIVGYPTSRRNPIKYIFQMYKFYKKNKFDIVYFNNCDIVSLSILRIAKLAEVPIRIFHAHNSANTKPLGKIHKFSEKYNRKRVNKIATDLLACSENAGNFIFGKYPYTVITNGIDIEKYKFDLSTREKKRSELGVAEKKVVLFAARFTEIKNPLFAMDVANELYSIDSNYRILICGDGPLFEKANEKLIQDNSSEYISLLGNRFDINELYSAADYFIMPSQFEGFPFVLVEAQCSGLKCICSTNIEKNTNLSGTIEYLSLDLTPKGWAKKIISYSINDNRESYKDIITDAGFDISKTVDYLENIFEGGES